MVAEIPEYYSLDLSTTGNIEFIKGDVSSKLCGNARFNLRNKGSKLKASKIKSEFFTAEVHDGSFEISSYLESADFKFKTSNSLVNLKKVGLSGNGLIEMAAGSLECGSFYCGTSFPTPRDKQKIAVANAISISSKRESVEELIPGLESAIEAGNHSKMVLGSLRAYFGNYQGNSMIYG